MSIAKTEGKEYKHAFHFESNDHEYASAKEGVWLFMVTEVLMFGGLLVAFLIFKGLYPESFKAGGDTLSWKYGAFNTMVLIFSSLTMALAIYFIRINQRNKAFWSLIVTIICGGIFMCVKYLEYSHKIHLGIMPGKLFSQVGMTDPHYNLYFSFYYLLTGLHGLHVLIGMGMIAWIAIRIKKGMYSSQHWTGVEGVGIFWHLVDLVWIYLFPLLYLVH
jgi:cytochrome c oxidase subunit III